VFRTALHLSLSTLCLLALLLSAPAQDEKPAKKEAPKKAAPEDEYSQFFTKPETPMEFWRAVHFEISVGRYDLAARNLHGLVALKPDDKDLLAIVDKFGMSAILGLRNIRKWGDDPKDTKQARKDIEELIRMVSAARKKVLTDPERINRFIANLHGTDEERDYAIQELYKSGAAAAPQMIDALRSSSGDDRADILFALRHMPAEAVPPILAALDIPDPALQIELIDAVLGRVTEHRVYDPVAKREIVDRTTDLPTLHRYAGTDPAPYWWWLSTSSNAAVREKATQALSLLLGLPPSKLPPAKRALTEAAERYFRHQVRFLDPGAVTVWRWDGQHVVAGWPGVPTVPTTAAEEYYGLRFARQALAIDPKYEPAQVVLLSLALEKGVERSGLDDPLAKGAPDVDQLVATVNPSLVVTVLERALTDKNLPVILSATRALGQLSDVRAVRATSLGEAALVRALYYPNRRIQMAAADTILRLPQNPSGTGTSRRAQQTGGATAARVVEILRRALAAGPAPASRPKVIIAQPYERQTTEASRALEQAGFEPIALHTGRDVLRRLNQAADIDLLLIDANLPDPGLAPLLGQLRGDVNTGLLPVVVLAPADLEVRLRRITETYHNVSIAPPGLALDPDAQKKILPVLITEAQGAPLSQAQLTEYAERSLRWLARMARGEVPGYDIRPAADTVLEALRSGRFSTDAQLDAVEVAAHLPGRKPQTDLLAVLLDPKRAEAVRGAAALALERHIEQHGVALSPGEIASLQALYASTDLPSRLRESVALVVGSLRPDARLTGERLRQFQPAPPGPPRTKESDKPRGPIIKEDGKKGDEEKKE
jgi:CheY-like chemotaxis protein